VSLADAFKTDAARNTAGRSHRKLVEAAAKEFIQFIQPIFAQHVLEEGKLSEAVKIDLIPTVFAVAKDRITVSPEFGHLASLRSAWDSMGWRRILGNTVV
jgi:hypothetical protein